MNWYPFDVQRCKIILEMKSTYAPFTNPIVDSFEYLGEETLTQYEVGLSFVLTLHIIIGGSIKTQRFKDSLLRGKRFCSYFWG